jgi:ectoine hydroxylase-related dioxygenase (phytanoyl-CoA dioxygenase family)
MFSLSDADKALLPTDEEVAFYREHGWYLSRQIFSDEEIDALAAEQDRYYAGHRDRKLPVRPPRIAYWEPAHGDTARNNDYVFYESTVMANILAKPVLGAIAARLSGTDQLRLFNSALMYKPTNLKGDATVVPWHFDRHYWKTCTSNEMLTAFLPLHDCDEEMGTIVMVDGSHTWKEVGDNDTTTKHFLHRDKNELEQMLERNAHVNNAVVRKVPMRFKKGQVSFHHCLTYHGSGPNLSARPRRAFSLHYQDRTNQYRPYHLSTGELLAYNHDVLCRKTPEGHPDYSDPEICPVLWEGRI